MKQEDLDRQIRECTQDVVADGNAVWGEAFQIYGFENIVKAADPVNPQHQALLDQIAPFLPQKSLEGMPFNK